MLGTRGSRQSQFLIAVRSLGGTAVGGCRAIRLHLRVVGLLRGRLHVLDRLSLHSVALGIALHGRLGIIDARLLLRRGSIVLRRRRLTVVCNDDLLGRRLLHHDYRRSIALVGCRRPQVNKHIKTCNRGTVFNVRRHQAQIEAKTNATEAKREDVQNAHSDVVQVKVVSTTLAYCSQST